MRIICERSLEHDQEFNICLVDFDKAFERIRWDKLMEILTKTGVDWRERRLIKELYMGQVVTVRTNEGETDLIEIGRGTRHGCPMSPVLFNLYDEAMIRESFDDLEEGIIIGGKFIKEIRFADDKGVLACTQEGLQKLVSSLDLVAYLYGMKISRKKTKVMKVTAKVTTQEQTKLNITLIGQLLEQVESFKYLGGILN